MSNRPARLFVALSLPESWHVRLGQYLGALAARFPANAVRWVDPHRIHLTLAFLGDTAADRIPRIVFALDDVAGQRAPFELALGEPGCFPTPRRPRVFWVGVAGDLAALAALQSAVSNALQALGWTPDERPFQPHLTLGRVNRGARAAMPADLAAPRAPAAPFSAVHLYRSDLQPGGPRYTVLHESPFAGGSI